MNTREIQQLLDKAADELTNKDDPFIRQWLSYFLEGLESDSAKKKTTGTLNAGEHILLQVKKIVDDRLNRGRW